MSWLLRIWGRVGYFSNEHRFLVESTLQSISSNFFFVKTNQLGGSNPNVILTRQICGQQKTYLTAKFVGSRHCASAFFLQVPEKRTDIDFTLLYILILGRYTKFVRKNKMLASRRLLPAAMLECWPQVCRIKITFGLLLTDWFVSTKKNSMKCLVNWISLEFRVRSRNTKNPNLKWDFGYFSNLGGFSVESSLRSILSRLLLWKRNNSTLVI